ncbi:MAG: hypothetical protein HC923_02535 [Myxococcales bacterium]|nr:hypothetical protein [Myxococcales bacterium]
MPKENALEPPKETRPPRGSKRSGVIAGPRGMEIPVREVEVDVASLARDCVDSSWAGLSRLSTLGCPADCAILVDDVCAGRTPAVDRPLAPGTRRVLVVCDAKTVRKLRVRFVEGETRSVVCR